MDLIKTSITIHGDLLRQAKQISGNFSLLVTKALKEYIRMEKVKKAVNTFGKWEKRKKNSVTIVDNLRTEESRGYANRLD
ncbi:MAG TPA: type II toxin-antitoxin system CcdA family antitoxin [Nitrospinota bacterium]|jgi:hypothetical protein|nr:type II toxin-antitoxin system CcdA family antitoxin [Nitrospinota bacterium]|tara:strand:+ start:720 stop:959 length:240 start_codon:yes stop_codon:yes gene_type:complete